MQERFFLCFISTKCISNIFRVFAYVLLLLCFKESQAQFSNTDLSNLRTKQVVLESDSIQLDSLSIVYGSFSIRNKRTSEALDSSFYKLNYESATLRINSAQATDTVVVKYRVFPFNFSQSKAFKDPKLKESVGLQPAGIYQYKIQERKQAELFDYNGLDYTGSFGRGITVGNSQDLVVNSNFNLQMSGKLPNDIEILAAISDNDIPFQPEGNTQQLQEFDKIFIQLKKDQHSLLLGDFTLPNPDSYFMNFTRNLQGVQVRSGLRFGQKEDNRLYVAGSGAVAKGNYQRMQFNGSEGNQGPYKLIGSNGETFIIILSGTERVYIDGKKLVRGTENDYVIDYNTAELTFTPNELITKDRRITVEFEYADRNYLRSLFFLESGIESKKWRIDTKFFSEQDAKNQPLVEGLISDDVQNTFESVGDNVEDAVLNSFAPIDYSPDRILYELIDTLGQDSILRYSNNSEANLYAASFSFVGIGEGDYKVAERNFNGRAYEWIAPDSLGISQGDYSPIIKLVSPIKRQLIIVSSEYQINSKNTVNAEFGLSNQDANTFSDIDDQDDKGVSARVQHDGSFKFKKKEDLGLSASSSYEFRQAEFRPLEPYRQVEFARNWNLDNIQTETDEHIGQTSLRFTKSKSLLLQHQYRFLNRTNNYQGHENTTSLQYNNKLISLEGENKLLNSNSLSNSSSSVFWRPNLHLAYHFLPKIGWTTGFKIQQEENRISNIADTVLANTSFKFNIMEWYIQNKDTASNHLKASYTYRNDYIPSSNNYIRNSYAQTANFSGQLTRNPKNVFSWNASYRVLYEQDEASEVIQKSNSTATGTLNHTAIAWKGLVRSSLSYQLTSGQEPKLEYFYQIDPNNEGEYIYNGNGENDLANYEFSPGNPELRDTTFNRILVPSTEYIRTNNVQFNYSLNLSPKALWINEETKFQKVINHFSSNSTFSLSRRIQATEKQALQFIPYPQEDSTIVAESLNHKSSLFYNRNNPKFELNTYILNLVNKTLLLTGSDSRRKNEYGLGGKYNFSKKLSLRGQGSSGVLINDSEAFANRNYHINYWQIEPSLSLIPNQKWKLEAKAKVKKSVNNYLSLYPELGDSISLALDDEAVKLYDLSLEFRYGSISKNSISAKLAFAQVSYNRESTNSPSAYALLESLQPGSNYRWNAQYTTRLSGNIEFSLSYEGRKSGDNRIRHLGRASIRALF